MNDFFDFEEAWFKKAKHLKLDEKSFQELVDRVERIDRVMNELQWIADQKGWSLEETISKCKEHDRIEQQRKRGKS